jgi:NAD(P)-dependent dehydrogenase (short-subunit alcohol dehydrogenase family)
MAPEGRPVVAVVTGNPGGLGRVIAARLAQRPSEVVLVDSQPAGGTPSSVRSETVDWADVGALQALIERIASDLGGIDELVNLPVAEPTTGFLEVEQAEWDHVFSVNSKRVYFLMQAAARVMAKRGGGRIVNVATIDGKGWWGTLSPALAGTEAAVIAVDRIAALQLSSDNINVNTVTMGLLAEPGRNGHQGFAGLDGTAHAARGGSGQAGRLIPLDRGNEPDDIAAAVEFLLSPGGRNITGQSLNVDGGLIFD